MTSSAASDTDRARNRTGRPSLVSRPRQPCSTSTPPWPLPPGRCTSSSTTAGRCSRTSATADSTSGASPTMSTAAPISARTPERNIRWSSTRTTVTRGESGVMGLLGEGGWDGGRRQRQLDLGALLEPAHASLPTVAGHPPDDGLPHTEPVPGYLVEVEAGAVVADERLDPLVARLDIDGHRRRTVPDRVEDRLAD